MLSILLALASGADILPDKSVQLVAPRDFELAADAVAALILVCGAPPAFSVESPAPPELIVGPWTPVDVAVPEHLGPADRLLQQAWLWQVEHHGCPDALAMPPDQVVPETLDELLAARRAHCESLRHPWLPDPRARGAARQLALAGGLGAVESHLTPGAFECALPALAWTQGVALPPEDLSALAQQPPPSNPALPWHLALRLQASAGLGRALFGAGVGLRRDLGAGYLQVNAGVEIPHRPILRSATQTTRATARAELVGGWWTPLHVGQLALGAGAWARPGFGVGPLAAASWTAPATRGARHGLELSGGLDVSRKAPGAQRWQLALTWQVSGRLPGR